jgi:hypothetical protein
VLLVAFPNTEYSNAIACSLFPEAGKRPSFGKFREWKIGMHGPFGASFGANIFAGKMMRVARCVG